MTPVMKENVKTTAFASEFDAPRWSVVSAEDCVANNLNYDDAAKIVRQMSESVSGLCIVTDEAANRLHTKQNSIKSDKLSHVVAPNTFAETL